MVEVNSANKHCRHEKIWLKSLCVMSNVKDFAKQDFQLAGVMDKHDSLHRSTWHSYRSKTDNKKHFFPFFCPSIQVLKQWALWPTPPNTQEEWWYVINWHLDFDVRQKCSAQDHGWEHNAYAILNRWQPRSTPFMEKCSVYLLIFHWQKNSVLLAPDLQRRSVGWSVSLYINSSDSHILNERQGKAGWTQHYLSWSPTTNFLQHTILLSIDCKCFHCFLHTQHIQQQLNRIRSAL